MNEQQVMLALLRGVLFEGPPEDQEKIKECADKIRALVAEYGDHGELATALVGAEIAAKQP